MDKNNNQSSQNNATDKKNLYFFIQKPRFAMVISIFITLVGIIAMMGLKLEKYPNITPPQIMVSASYPGASADVVESSVASLLESQINGVEDMLYMISTSSDESYQLQIYFKVGSDRNIDLVNVQNRIQQIQPKLPEDVKRLGVTAKQQVSGAGVAILNLASTDGRYSQLDVTNYASIFIKDEIARLPGVGEVNVYGAGNYSMRIWLDTEKMANLNVSVLEVQNAINTQNVQVSAGALGQEPGPDKQRFQITLRTKGRLLEPEEFENIIIRSNQDGSSIKIKDVARVELGSETYSRNGRVDGKPAALLQIVQIPGANAIEIVNEVEAKIAEISKTIPDGMELAMVHDDTLFIRESMKEVIKTIIETSIIVVAIIFIFLGDPRATLVPLIAIPVSLIGTFAALPMFDMSINLLTLFAMVLAVATVVDDAIVVIENVKRHLEDGKSPVEATQITMQEIGGALVSMALVLMAVFVPVSFMPGLSGLMYKQFAVCIAISIALSAVCALTLSPALCSIILRHEDPNRKPSNKISAAIKWVFMEFNVYFQKLTDLYLHYVKKFVYNKKLTLIVYGAIIALMLVLFKVIPTGFIPDEDQAVLMAQINLPAGASLARTTDVTERMDEMLQNTEGVEGRIVFVGMGPSNQAFMVIRLDEWEKREFNIFQKAIRKMQGKETDLSLNAILGRIRKDFSTIRDAQIGVFSPPAISGMSMVGGFEFQMLSKGEYTPQEMEQYANKLIMAANQNKDLTNVYTQYQANMLQYIVDIDYAQAMAQGIDLTELYSTLSSTLGTYYVNDFNKLGRVFRVQLQAEQKFRRSANDLTGIYVKNSAGKMVPITTVVSLKQSVGAGSITRYNQYRNVQFSGQPATGRSSGEAMKAMESVANAELPKDMGFEWSGTSKQEIESGGQTGTIIALALIFVYLFLVALYESWSIPLAVLLICPLAAAGALIFQLIMGQAFDLYSQVGMIMLIGLAAKQAILIVEFAKVLHEEDGMTIEEAAVEASRIRFRAIMMTVVAFVVGMLPLILAHGAGASSRISVGSTVFGGMLAAGTLGTIMTPAFYVIIQHLVDIVMNKKQNVEDEQK